MKIKVDMSCNCTGGEWEEEFEYTDIIPDDFKPKDGEEVEVQGLCHFCEGESYGVYTYEEGK